MVIPVEVYGLLGIIVITVVMSFLLILWARHKDRNS